MVDGKHHFYGGVNSEAVGGGSGLVEAEIRRGLQIGCEIRYDTAVTRLIQDKNKKKLGLKISSPDDIETVNGRSVVLACGGFETNPEMRVRYLGPGLDLARV